MSIKSYLLPISDTNRPKLGMALASSAVDKTTAARSRFLFLPYDGE